VIAKRDGEVAELRFYVGGRWRESSSATNLGTVSAREAADYLLSLAESSERKAAQQAVFPATLADSVVVWPTLLRIARNERRPRDARTQAVFWLGQMAGEAATKGLNDLVGEDDLDREVRKQAVFALSQQRDKAGVPSLIRVVRTSKDPEIRKTALFWLAQSNDPRALDLIEELLTKR
jgi:HEAT repeat protein